MEVRQKPVASIINHSRALRIAGAVIQGLVLGALLALALTELVLLDSGATIFRYQGF